MEMEALKWVLGILQLVVTAWCVHIYSEVNKSKEIAQKLSDEIAAHKLHTSESYMTKTELTRAFDSINRALETLVATMHTRFDRMDSKLDMKMDKG